LRVKYHNHREGKEDGIEIWKPHPFAATQALLHSSFEAFTSSAAMPPPTALSRTPGLLPLVNSLRL
jgi:hypothetical protein